MKCLASIFFILIFSSLYSQSKIIGGNEINIEDAPWMANMRIINTAGIKLFDRSGIIVSKNLVLTASHNWPDYDYDYLAVQVGGAADNEGQYQRVHRFIPHPDKDITLLELSEPLKFGKNIQPIDYRSSVDELLYAPETDAIVYGWGRTNPDTPAQSLKLRAANVKIISHEKANKIHGSSVVSGNTIVSVGETKICMGGKGDSGGPLVVRNNQQKPVLAGVTIRADTRPVNENSGLTVYSKVKPIIEWIDNHKCEIIGKDIVPSLGTSFEIVNMPANAVYVEWKYSGLTEINSTIDHIDVIPATIEREVRGYLSATITTNSGTVTINKELTIMPRIDIDINIRYNETTSKYEIIAKTVNMESIDDKDILKCKNIIDNVKLLGFIWTYDNNIAIGQEAIFEANPNSPASHTISVSKYDCDYTIRLEKTFVIQHRNNEFITVHNEPGTIIIGNTQLNVDIDIYEELQMTHIKDYMENSILLNTSNVTVKNQSKKIVNTENYKISLYSRKGNLLHSVNFDSSMGPLHINTSSFYSDIYILHIHNLDTDNVINRILIINP